MTCTLSMPIAHVRFYFVSFDSTLHLLTCNLLNFLFFSLRLRFLPTLVNENTPRYK